MNEYTVLIVEDDELARQGWARDIREFNRQPARKLSYNAVFASTKNEGLKVLRRTVINCAVIDLRLPHGDTDREGVVSEATGNQVLEQVLIDTGIPAVVYSGYPAEASALVRASNIKVVGKTGNGGKLILEQLAEFEGLMAAMEEARRRISQESAKLFNSSIWKRWEKTWKSSSDREVITGMITRQIVAHVADKLSVQPSYHHPDEFYIIPAISAERLDTGNLLELDGTTYVVVTPRCNLARDPYPDHIMLALCSTMADKWSELRTQLRGNKKDNASAGKKMQLYATQGHATSTHFLPPCGDKGPWLVDFREIRTETSTSVPKLLKARFGTISSQFVPNLIQRYAAYLGRIGQPDIDHNYLVSHCTKTE
jgi:CheY-like chemotaxis protein